MSAAEMANDTEPVTKHANWWSQRSALEKSLIAISVLALVGIVALVLVLFIIKNKESEQLPSNKNVCLTPGCIHAASQALEKIDNSVNPCDDFYNYACGNFVKNTIIPDERSAVTSFLFVYNIIQKQLRALFNDKIDPNEPRPFKMVKNFYKACMNTTLIEQQGLKPLTDKLELLGGWPVLVGNSWNTESTWNWIEAITQIRKIGFNSNYILGLYIDVNWRDSTKRMIEIDQPQLGLDQEYLTDGLSNKFVKAYYEYMVDTAVSFGADKSQAERELLDSLNFEIALANISLSYVARRNNSVIYNPFSMQEIQQKYPYIPWAKYINGLLPNGVKIDENEMVSISVLSYFDNLKKLLENTPKRTIANYFMWRITLSSASFLNQELQNRQLTYYKMLYGIQAQAPRWKQCVDITNSRIPIAGGTMYVRNHFKENTKRSAIEIVNGVRNAFENIILEVPWMDERTRQAALHKLRRMTAHIGYPNEVMDNKEIENYYEKLEIDPNNYLLSVVNINLFETDYALDELRKPVNKTDWVKHSRLTSSNPSYRADENSILLMAGLWQGNFYSNDRPKYLNYGAVGYVIGHEITHGFDNRGREFDANGNYFDWWEADTKLKFLEKAKCLIEQYSNYTEPTTQLKLNGANTVGENIADNGGVKEAYYAYEKWVHDNGPEPRLPGLDFSPKQLFWLSAAQMWCSVFRTESTRSRILTAVHSPLPYRVLVPLSNMKEFARDFNCPAGSPMNPVRKCEIW